MSQPSWGEMTSASEGSASVERPLLSVRDLNVGYGDTQVLWDVSMELRRGEVVALVGANGAGKSTLLSTLSGLLRTWSGHIELIGRDITRMRAEHIVRLGMAHVPQ
ncbi:MAG TPA: ATP-binding cassette domain-containing protein, partial [Ktedonobacterales bacterium]